ncbi:MULTISPECIES: hypothetical protein [Catenuloplanes]|uniref:Uncharacterized protein n=1 Tax=Catenuloplanes niger TaxID=587534 RepID=A0AAE3ZPX7_9ACTN|nr:hypothetical protein [Catenuloplanes niger]MDR7323767.1 hypothetical protein [Catenuloplanes niger]
MRSNTSRHRHWAGLAGLALVALSAVVSVGAVVGTAAAGVGYRQKVTVEIGATVGVPPSPSSSPSAAAKNAAPNPAAMPGTVAVPRTASAMTSEDPAVRPAGDPPPDVALPDAPLPADEDDARPAPESVRTSPAEAAVIPSPEPAVSDAETPIP